MPQGEQHRINVLAMFHFSHISTEWLCNRISSPRWQLSFNMTMEHKSVGQKYHIKTQTYPLHQWKCNLFVSLTLSKSFDHIFEESRTWEFAVVRRTWDHTGFLTSFQRLKIVGVSSTAPILKQFAASVVHVEEESVFNRLAGALFILQGTQFIEDEVLGLCSICWGGKQIFRICEEISHQTSKYRLQIWQNNVDF